MANVLIIGDSQAGNPGAAAAAALEAAGHTVTRIHHDGQSPVRYETAGAQPNAPGDSVSPYDDLRSQYKALAAGKDVVVLIFGHNSPAGTATRNALIQMKSDVHAPVLMSGPPLYPPTARPTSGGQASRVVGDALRAQNQRIFTTRYIDAYPSTPADLPRDANGWHFTPGSAQGWGQAIAEAVGRFLAGAPAGGGGGTTLGPH